MIGFNPADFQKGEGQGDVAADQVSHYLQEEEDHLLDSILQAFHISIDEAIAARKTGGDVLSSRFAKAIDKVIERIDQFSTPKRGQLAREELEIVIAHVTAAFRHYQEILEGCASRLFAELEKMRVDQLGDETIRGVERVKDKLIQQISDCMQQIHRLEKKLGKYRLRFLSKWVAVAWVISLFEPAIDRSILRKLRNIRSMVNRAYQMLTTRYTRYQELNDWASERKARLEGCAVFQTLSPDVRQLLAEIYRLLKMRNRSLKTTELVVKELNRLLSDEVTVEEAVKIFEEYGQALRGAFFELRRQIPEQLDEAVNLKQVKMDIIQGVQRYRSEVHILGSTVFKYRDFILNTHPDPYVRARLGFAESTVGPEPETTKILVRLGHRVEALDKCFRKLAAAVEGFDPSQSIDLDLGHFDRMLEELDHLVLEARNAEDAYEHYQEILEKLEEVHELYIFDPYRIMGVEKVLRRSLRLDSFNILVKEKRFVDLYETHVQIRGPIPHEWQREVIAGLQATNNELKTLRLGGNGSKAETRDRCEEWYQNGDKLLTGLEQFLLAMKAQAPISVDHLMGDVRIRHYEVLEFVYAYRCFLQELQERHEAVPHHIALFLERVHQIEGDFSYLVSHLGRHRGPMTMKELRSIENL